MVLESRLSFPATGPPDPGNVSEGVSEGVFEGSLKGFRRGPLLKPFQNPSETPSETLPGSGGSVAGNESLDIRGYFQDVFRDFPYALSGYALWTLSTLQCFM